MDNQQPGGSDDRFDRLEALIIGVKSDLGGQIAGLKTDIEKMSVRLDEVHAGVKIVAEGHGALVDHIEKIHIGIDRLEAGQEQLDLRMLAIESKLGVPKRPAKRSRGRRT